MPPRLALPCLNSRATSTLLPSLCRNPHLHCRYASILSSLSDNKGAYSKRKRLGRGPASGKGKTSGRGHKGQKQHGKVPAGFQGGQTPIEVVHGTRGFDNIFALDLANINLDRIQSWIDQGRLDKTRPITVKELNKSRCVHGIKDGVKLLARNAHELRDPIHITVSRASGAAIAAVEALGGTVTSRYYTRQSIKRIMRGEMHPTLSLLSQPPAWLATPTPTPSASSSLENPHQVATTTDHTPSTDKSAPPADTAPASVTAFTSKEAKDAILNDPLAAPLVQEIRKYRYRLPDPASRKDLEYYRDPAHRGYLSYQLQEGQGPSLFFKSPLEIATSGIGGSTLKEKKKDSKVTAANRLW